MATHRTTPSATTAAASPSTKTTATATTLSVFKNTQHSHNNHHHHNNQHNHYNVKHFKYFFTLMLISCYAMGPVKALNYSEKTMTCKELSCANNNACLISMDNGTQAGHAYCQCQGEWAGRRCQSKLFVTITSVSATSASLHIRAKAVTSASENKQTLKKEEQPMQILDVDNDLHGVYVTDFSVSFWNLNGSSVGCSILRMKTVRPTVTIKGLDKGQDYMVCVSNGGADLCRFKSYNVSKLTDKSNCVIVSTNNSDDKALDIIRFIIVPIIIGIIAITLIIVMISLLFIKRRSMFVQFILFYFCCRKCRCCRKMSLNRKNKKQNYLARNQRNTSGNFLLPPESHHQHQHHNHSPIDDSMSFGTRSFLSNSGFSGGGGGSGNRSSVISDSVRSGLTPDSDERYAPFLGVESEEIPALHNTDCLYDSTYDYSQAFDESQLNSITTHNALVPPEVEPSLVECDESQSNTTHCNQFTTLPLRHIACPEPSYIPVTPMGAYNTLPNSPGHLFCGNDDATEYCTSPAISGIDRFNLSYLPYSTISTSQLETTENKITKNNIHGNNMNKLNTDTPVCLQSENNTSSLYDPQHTRVVTNHPVSNTPHPLEPNNQMTDLSLQNYQPPSQNAINGLRNNQEELTATPRTALQSHNQQQQQPQQQLQQQFQNQNITPNRKPQLFRRYFSTPSEGYQHSPNVLEADKASTPSVRQFPLGEEWTRHLQNTYNYDTKASTHIPTQSSLATEPIYKHGWDVAGPHSSLRRKRRPIIKRRPLSYDFDYYKRYQLDYNFQNSQHQRPAELTNFLGIRATGDDATQPSSQDVLTNPSLQHSYAPPSSQGVYALATLPRRHNRHPASSPNPQSTQNNHNDPHVYPYTISHQTHNGHNFFPRSLSTSDSESCHNFTNHPAFPKENLNLYRPPYHYFQPPFSTTTNNTNKSHRNPNSKEDTQSTSSSHTESSISKDSNHSNENSSSNKKRVKSLIGQFERTLPPFFKQNSSRRNSTSTFCDEEYFKDLSSPLHYLDVNKRRNHSSLRKRKKKRPLSQPVMFDFKSTGNTSSHAENKDIGLDPIFQCHPSKYSLPPLTVDIEEICNDSNGDENVINDNDKDMETGPSRQSLPRTNEEIETPACAALTVTSSDAKGKDSSSLSKSRTAMEDTYVISSFDNDVTNLVTPFIVRKGSSEESLNA